MSTTPPPALRPYLTASHDLLWREADDFAAEHVTPRAARMEAAPGRVERKVADLMAVRRWFAVTVPAVFGGLGAGHVAKTILVHRVARVSAAAATILQATLIPVGALLLFATYEQKGRWLPQVADGSLLLSIAVTEPLAGGHIGGVETTAERIGKEWVITGSKIHIGNSHVAGAHLVVARTATAGVSTSQALTAFMVEADRPGLCVPGHRPGLGLHGFSTGRLDLDHVRVPEDNVVGEVGQGLAVAQSSSILYGRPNLAAVSLGIHEAVVDTTTARLKTRPRYQGTLSDLPVLRDRVGDMEARLRAARILAYQSVHLLDQGLPCDADLINAKYLGHKWAAQSAQDAIELHGAHAFDRGYVLQRLWRDIQHTYPPAGTGEVQRIRLADAALGEDHIQWSERLAAETAWACPDRRTSPRAWHPVNPNRRARARAADPRPPQGSAAPRPVTVHPSRERDTVPPPVTTSAPITPLTPTLKRVAQHLANGLAPKDIATQAGLSAVTVRQYIRDIRECLHCPPRCKLPVIVHRLLVDLQVTIPTADRPAPSLSSDQMLLLRAVAEHSDARDITIAAKVAPADLRATLDQLLADTGARDITHLVILAHGWKLLMAEQPHPARSGASL
ncbi:Acyl-CoA dehydrogenase [Streptomyces sp. SolWspMP-5a-2]|nr:MULTISPECIES: acyl-CoA dehydrogenase family protein [unclassified Streptomyces]SCD34948.1 Acyl-CoA dehydrogenase [Streptomyces sp. SolWspMP-5a-2]